MKKANMDLSVWAETAQEGDYAAWHERMSVEQTEPGYFVVTHDTSGGVVWEGNCKMPADDENREGGKWDAYDLACQPDSGSRCGWSDSELDAANKILARGDLRLVADDFGLVVAKRDRD